MLKNQKWLLTGICLSILLGFAFVAIEMFVDGEAVTFFEFIFDSIEKSLIFIGAGGVFVLLHQLREQHKAQLSLLCDLEVARNDGANWRSKVKNYISGLGKEIERQFRVWQFTEAESEVAMLLLKGLSHKEISHFRGTAETTIRQQARSIYQKSGLPGKTAFSAYFLEDLLPAQQISSLLDTEKSNRTATRQQLEELV